MFSLPRLPWQSFEGAREACEEGEEGQRNARVRHMLQGRPAHRRHGRMYRRAFVLPGMRSKPHRRVLQRGQMSVRLRGKLVSGRVSYVAHR